MLLASLLLAVVGPVADGGCENFGRVGPGLYRGAEPSEACLDHLAKLGVRMILNLRDDEEATEREKSLAEALGLRFTNIPMSGVRKPESEEVQRALEILGATENQPAFVHCKRGRDRTGVVVAAWRMAREGWSLDQAYEEAKRFRLAWWQVRMKDFIREFEVPKTQENAR
ncbi:MAG TPA: tyrosine-protein phosphatase [Candidatus Polarisedimenticolaceae bacterium]